jgi:hypothetical protein
VGDDYFSLVRVFSDIKHILAAKAKLEWNGDRTVVTQIATGYALWVWEPEATSSTLPDKQTDDSQDEDVNQRGSVATSSDYHGVRLPKSSPD